MTFSEASQIKTSLEAAVASFSAKLGEFETGFMGLTPDAVKQSPSFGEAKKSFDAAFTKLRSFNTFYVKTFKKEIAAERAARRAA